MRKQRNMILFCIGLLNVLLQGCASSSLNMELSIYKEDPLFKNVIVQAELLPIKLSLEQIENDVDKMIAMQIDIADKFYDAYETFWILDGKYELAKAKKTYDDAAHQRQMNALSGLKTRLSNHKGLLQVKGIEVRKLVSQTKSTYQALLTVVPENFESVDFTSSSYMAHVQRRQKLQNALTIELSLIQQKLNSIISDPNDPYYQSTKYQWGKIYEKIQDKKFRGGTSADELDGLDTKIMDLTKAFKEIKTSLVSLNSDTSSSIKNAKRSNNPIALVSKIMENPTVYKMSDEEESNMLRSVDLLNSQLDRMQDVSSPVWRIVTDPENEDNWNTEFSRSYFYAKGNSGVVVVRDTPLKYRIQEASNNPAALVQAQLQISRAVADAAIQIAAAKTGVPLTSSTKEESGIKKEDNPTYQQDTETLFTKKAKLNAMEAVYSKTVTALKANLDSYLGQLSKLDPAIKGDKVKIKELNVTIVRFLTAQKELLSLGIVQKEGE